MTEYAKLNEKLLDQDHVAPVHRDLEKKIDEAEPQVLNRASFQSPPESTPIYRPLGWLFVTLIVTVQVILNVILSPILLICIIVRGIIFCNLKYRRPPKDVKIAIIGGGWSGLQACSRFKELGVENITCFERYDDIGGTWHPNLCYHGLTIHGAMTFTSFSKFPYSETDGNIAPSKFLDEMDGRVNAQEVRRYIHRFASAKQLRPHYKFDSTVTGIEYDSKNRKATVHVQSSQGEKSQEKEFDLVVFTSQASFYDIPKLDGQEEFKGEIWHSMQFHTPQFKDAVANKKKVLIVGGGKGGSDMVINFVDAGYDNYTWAVRKNYLFWKYEASFHDRSLKGMFRGFFILMATVVALFSTKLCVLMHWAVGAFVSYGDWHLDLSKFHFGVLSPCQRRSLSKANPYRPTEPVKYTPTGVVFKDGTREDFDVVIWATGCRSGIDKLTFTKDGNPFNMDTKAGMYNHFIVPEFPVLCSGTQLWTTFGPVRSVNTAELAVYHLCVRPELSEAEMLKRTSRQLASARSATKSFLFTSGSVAIVQWLRMHIDLILAGVETVPAFLWHGVESFVFGKQSAIKFDVIPNGSVKTQGVDSVPISAFACNAVLFSSLLLSGLGAIGFFIWQAIVGFNLF